MSHNATAIEEEDLFQAIDPNEEQDFFHFSNANKARDLIHLSAPDPEEFIKVPKTDSRNIYRTPLIDEFTVEYFYCLFVGIFAIVIDPFEWQQLLLSMVSSLMWSLVLLMAFYRQNMFVWIMSTIVGWGLKARCFAEVITLSNSMENLRHCILPTLVIVIGTMGVLLGMPHGSVIKTKSFDGSTMLLVTFVGGLLGMASRFLFHFANSPLLLYSCCAYLGLAASLPFCVGVWGTKVRKTKRMVWICTAMFVWCLFLVVGIWWWSGDAQAAAKTQIFRARYLNPNDLVVVLEEVTVALMATKIGFSTDVDLTAKPFVAPTNDAFCLVIRNVKIPLFFYGLWSQERISAIFSILSSTLKALKVLVLVIVQFSKPIIKGVLLNAPLYYSSSDSIPIDLVSAEVSKNPASLQITAMGYAERDSLISLWGFVVILAVMNLYVWAIYKLFRPLNHVHHETVKNLLEPASSREAVDWNTYERRIIISNDYVQKLRKKVKKSHDSLTDSEKIVIKLLGKSGISVI